MSDSCLTASRPSVPKMLGTADDDPNRGVERMDTRNKSEELVIASMEPNESDILEACIGVQVMQTALETKWMGQRASQMHRGDRWMPRAC